MYIENEISPSFIVIVIVSLMVMDRKGEGARIIVPGILDAKRDA